MNKFAAVTAASLVALALAGCAGGPVAGSTENPFVREWVATPAGDINCLVSSASHERFTVNCDFATVTDIGTHTTEDSRQVDGAWVSVDQQEVFCLSTTTAYEYKAYDCDWANPR